jgi:hypothetical protein
MEHRTCHRHVRHSKCLWSAYPHVLDLQIETANDDELHEAWRREVSAKYILRIPL